jgi:hypothetical protein
MDVATHQASQRSRKSRPKEKQARRAAVVRRVADVAMPAAAVSLLQATAAAAASASAASAADFVGEASAVAPAAPIVKQARPEVGQRPFFHGLALEPRSKWLEVAATPMFKLAQLPQPCGAAVLCSNLECNNLQFVPRYVRNRGGATCAVCGAPGKATWFLAPPPE